MNKKYDSVHCKTKEQWDFVLEKLGYSFEFPWDYYKEKSVLYLKAEAYGSIEYDSNCYSFEEWCQENNYTVYVQPENFIKGEWYTADGWSNTFYAKFDNSNLDRFNFRECVREKIYSKEKNWRRIKGNFRHVPLSEIQHLLPKEESKLKKGDILEILADNPYCTSFKKGNNCTVKNIINDTVYVTDDWVLGLNEEGIHWKIVDSKESLIDKAKRLYPVGTKVKSLYKDTVCIVKKHSHVNYSTGYKASEDQIWFTEDSICPLIYNKGEWAEIIEDDFVLPKKWCIAVTKENKEILGKWRSAGPIEIMSMESNIIYGYIESGCGYWSEKSKYSEITFDQFKKYVLKESDTRIPGGECMNYKSVIKVTLSAKNKNNEEIVIPKITIPESKINYNISTNLPKLELSLPQNKAKQIKKITLEKFSITI